MGTIGGSHCRRHRNQGSASGTCGADTDAELLSRYPTAGSSAKFRTFLRDQVKPFVEEHYRTSGADAVLGESLAGLFVFETYLSEPELFGSYGAIDPSLWWDKEALSQTTIRKVDERHKGHALMLAVAKEQSEKPAALQRTISALQSKGMTFCLAIRPEHTHSTIYQQTSPEAIQYLMPPVEEPTDFRINCTKRGLEPLSLTFQTLVSHLQFAKPAICSSRIFRPPMTALVHHFSWC